MHNHALISQFPRYTHAFEPLLRSVEICKPGFNLFDSVEVVSNTSNLRKLFHLFSNETCVVDRFQLEWRRGTLFLAKWTGDPSLKSSMGHGAGFEKETCRYPFGDNDLIRTSASQYVVRQALFLHNYSPNPVTV